MLTMQIVEAEEMTYTDSSSPSSYVDAANEKLADGWALYGPPSADERNGWILQYYIKQKNKNKTTVKD